MDNYLDMSTITWLHTITPWTLIVGLGTLLSAIPLPKTLKHFPSEAFIFKPLTLKKITLILLILLGLGWLMALLASHTTTPVIRVNIQATSLLLLLPMLYILAIILGYRLFQRNNGLFLLLYVVAHLLKPLLIFIAHVLAEMFSNHSHRFTRHDTEDENESEEVISRQRHSLNKYSDPNFYQ